MVTSRALLKHQLYEEAVQTPELHCDLFEKIYLDLHRTETGELPPHRPLHLREDFCGTHAISAAWARKGRDYRATGFDLDVPTLEVGRELRRRALKRELEVLKRVKIRKSDVRAIETGDFDIAVACNFSFYIFHSTLSLLEYFSAVHASLAPDGIFVLETAGGPGMIETTRESKRIRIPALREPVTYTWDQHDFNPIQGIGDFRIHFKGKTPRSTFPDAFRYDWRLWSIPEVKDLLLIAGFDEVAVYWELEDENGNGMGAYERTNTGDNAWAWIAYVVGIKSPNSAQLGSDRRSGVDRRLSRRRKIRT